MRQTGRFPPDRQLISEVRHRGSGWPGPSILPLALVALLLIHALLNGGCAGVSRAPHATPGYREVGMASWYGPKFHGRTTANGERYNMLDFTAAHKTLPFDTVVRITRLDTGKSVVVRINDRGPFIRGRIVDLSYAAARELGTNREGVVKVRLEVISPQKSHGKAKPGGKK